MILNQIQIKVFFDQMLKIILMKSILKHIFVNLKMELLNFRNLSLMKTGVMGLLETKMGIVFGLAKNMQISLKKLLMETIDYLKSY